MGLFGKILNAVRGQELTDIRLSVPVSTKSVERSIKLRPKSMGYALSMDGSPSGESRKSLFVPPVYDFAEIARATDVEPYIDQSIRRHREQILKEGYIITGRDDRMVEYIKRRLFEISLVTGIPTENWIREAVTNLITYHNSFLALRRDNSRSSGNPIRIYGRLLEPISGIFPVDPVGMEVQVDKYGTPKRWRHTINMTNGLSAYKIYEDYDIVHVFIDRHTGHTFGTPYILPVLDDVRALRALEEMAIALSDREAFPLYHVKIGTDQLPMVIFDDGSTEVSQAQSELQGMPLKGFFVTSHRHEIEVVSKKGSVIDLKPYLDYFEARVLAGLRLSPMELGRTGSTNRACYSGDTETLTDKGWKFYWEVDLEKDKIATINPKTFELEFHKPEALYAYKHYKGKIYNFKSSSLDISVTPDHDMFFKQHGSKDWVKEKAENLLLPGSFLVVPAVDPSEDGSAVIDVKGYLKVDAEYWCRLIAYFINFGKINLSRNEIKFIIFKKQYSQAVKDVLDSLDIKFRYYDNDSYVKIAINNRQLCRHLAEACSCKIYPKRIPEYIISLPYKPLLTFFNTLVGSDPFLKETIYYSRTATLAGIVQFIAFKLGFYSKVLHDSRKPRVLISRETTEIPVSQENLEIEDYEGDVYCFTVPNHLFVTRRNGKITIQGNTASNINKNVMDAAKDYQQAFSAQVTFGIILPMLLEGGFDVREDNMVYLTFPPIDREEMRAHQNHGLQMLLASAISREEFRKEYLNLPDLTPDQEKKTTRELDAKIEKDLAKLAAAARPTATTTTKSVTNTVRNKAQPTNQSGTKPTKTRITANDLSEIGKKVITDIKKDIIKFIETEKDDLTYEEACQIIDEFGTRIEEDYLSSIKNLVNMCIDDGASLAVEKDGKEEDLTIGRRARGRFITNYIASSLRYTVAPFISGIKNSLKPDADGNDSSYKIFGILASLKSAVSRLSKEHYITSVRFGFAKAARTLGYSSIKVTNIDNETSKTIEVNRGALSYKNLVPSDDFSGLELDLGYKFSIGSEDD